MIDVDNTGGYHSTAVFSNVTEEPPVTTDQAIAEGEALVSICCY